MLINHKRNKSSQKFERISYHGNGLLFSFMPFVVKNNYKIAQNKV